MAIAALASLLLLAAPGEATAPGTAAAAQGGAPRPSQAPALTFTGKRFPPPGSPEDQALLERLLRENAAMISERSRAITATQRLKDAGYAEKLAAAARADASRAPRLEELAARLAAGWERVRDLMTRQWPVSPRVGCRPQGIQLEVLMGEPPGTRGAARLPITRESARLCLDRLEIALQPLRDANRELGATVSEVRGALAAAPPPDPGGAAPAPGAGPGSRPGR